MRRGKEEDPRVRVHTGALNMSASLYAAVGAMRRPAFARRSLMSAIVTRFRGTAAGTGSASGSLAAGARASERSWDFECMADDGGTENRRGTRFRRPFTLEWIGAVLGGGRLRRAPVRIAVRISVKAERMWSGVDRSLLDVSRCFRETVPGAVEQIAAAKWYPGVKTA